jgi:hypothetical protein
MIRINCDENAMERREKKIEEHRREAEREV